MEQRWVFDPQRQNVTRSCVEGQHEVIGMSGDIALYEGKPVVHTHMLVGNSDGTTQEVTFSLHTYPDAGSNGHVDPVTMQEAFPIRNGFDAN